MSDPTSDIELSIRVARNSLVIAFESREESVNLRRKAILAAKNEVDALADAHRDVVGLLHEVANAGVALDDPRIGYVEVQIDRDTWTALAAYQAQ